MRSVKALGDLNSMFVKLLISQFVEGSKGNSHALPFTSQQVTHRGCICRFMNITLSDKVPRPDHRSIGNRNNKYKKRLSMLKNEMKNSKQFLIISVRS